MWPLFGGRVGSSKDCPTALNFELAPVVENRAERLTNEEYPKKQKSQRSIGEYLNSKKQEEKNIEVKTNEILNKNTEEILSINEETVNIVQKCEQLPVPPSVKNGNYDKKKAERVGCTIKNKKLSILH